MSIEGINFALVVRNFTNEYPVSTFRLILLHVPTYLGCGPSECYSLWYFVQAVSDPHISHVDLVHIGPNNGVPDISERAIGS